MPVTAGGFYILFPAVLREDVPAVRTLPAAIGYNVVTEGTSDIYRADCHPRGKQDKPQYNEDEGAAQKHQDNDKQNARKSHER